MLVTAVYNYTDFLTFYYRLGYNKLLKAVLMKNINTNLFLCIKMSTMYKM